RHSAVTTGSLITTIRQLKFSTALKERFSVAMVTKRSAHPDHGCPLNYPIATSFRGGLAVLSLLELDKENKTKVDASGKILRWLKWPMHENKIAKTYVERVGINEGVTEFQGHDTLGAQFTYRFAPLVAAWLDLEIIIELPLVIRVEEATLVEEKDMTKSD
ncbi:hypothetical protein HAX54_041795, partial [Datura stramonium]|nr:hypothetical protein [Datura stramonium]